MVDYKKAAELLGIPVGTLYAWVHQGKIPHLRFGPRLVRFDKVQLEGFIQKHQVQAKEVG